MRKQKVKQKIPKTVQQSIPIDRVYRDGIFQYGKIFSKTWRFSDINYKITSEPEKKSLLEAYCSILNSLPSDAEAKISIYNRRLKMQPLTSHNEGYDKYVKETAELLASKRALSNNIVLEKYITISSEKKNIAEARTYFARIGSDLTADFGKISSRITELGCTERLRIFHDFFREEDGFDFNLKNAMAKGADFKDFICPFMMEFKKDCICLDDRYARVMFLRDYPSFLKDELIPNLTDFPQSMMLSIDIHPIPTDEAVKEVQKKMLAVETDITKWQQKQNENNNFSASIPYEYELMRSEIRELLNDMSTRDQRLMFVTLTLTHIADSLEALNSDTESLKSIGQKAFCNFAVLKFQQEAGFNTCLPYGITELSAVRTLTTESAAAIVPYKTQEIIDEEGLYYGINAVSRNLLMCSRKKLLNGNGFILGVSGSGKSFAAKMEIVMSALFTGDDIIVVDPENEYSSLITNLGGEIVRLSPNSGHHINAMDITREGDAEERPISMKSEFLISLFDRLLKSGDTRLGGGVGARDKSIIDRCCIRVYGDYLGGRSDKIPTLADFRRELLNQPEDEAHDLALSLELFATGSLDAFAHESNVNVNNRIVCYDILELGDSMKAIGLLIMLDNITNRVIANRKRGVFTRVYIDEAHLLLKNPYSAEFLLKAWKRFRKYGGLLTGITQDVDDCLKNETARGMLSNSEFLLMLNQSPSGREELSRLLGMSPVQQGYITNAPAGTGLIKFGGAIVPFLNDFPKDTELYRLMNTKLS